MAGRGDGDAAAIVPESPVRAGPPPEGSGPAAGPFRPAPAPSPDGEAAVARRIDLLFRMADDFATSIPLEELDLLLPSEGPRGVRELAAWLAALPGVSVYPDGMVHRSGATADGAARRRRGAAFQTAARHLFAGRLAPFSRWLRCVAVTGSSAYGAPERGDDLDFLVVCRSGTLWLFLAATYLELRLRGVPRFGTEPVRPCFNFVIDEASAAAELARPRGFVVAREALTAVPVVGDAYYGHLLRSAPWMRAELPRLYDRRVRADPGPEPPPVGWGLRLLNGAVYPLLAAYLQLQGLARNRPGRGGAPALFRTITRPDRLLFASGRFERLQARFDAAAAPAPRSAATGPGRPDRAAPGPRG